MKHYCMLISVSSKSNKSHYRHQSIYKQMKINLINILLFLLLNTTVSQAQLFTENKDIELGSYGCLWISTEDSSIKKLKEFHPKVLRIKLKFKVFLTTVFLLCRREQSVLYCLKQNFLWNALFPLLNNNSNASQFEVTIWLNSPNVV